MDMKRDINLRHFEAVATAGRLGSISNAALALNLSQPAITQAVAKVEAQLGHALLDRQPTGVTLTRAGELMSARIERALAYIVRGGNSVRRSARLPSLPNIERRITFGQLRALLTVDQAGSFAMASKLTGLSEPALHRSARELEQLLGILLLARHGRTVQPTPAATNLLRFARLALAEIEAGFDELAALRREGAGRIAIGTLPMAQTILLPRALARFSRANPAASIDVVEGPYADLLAGLRNGQLDFLIGALRDPPPVGDVVEEAIFDDDLVIVARKGHPLASSDFLDPARLRDFPWVIASSGAPMRTRWDAIFAEYELEPPRVKIESNSVTIGRGLMLNDDWLTLMSRDQFIFERRAGLLAEVRGHFSSKRKIGITIRDDWRPTQLQAAFVTEFKAACKDWTSEKLMERKPFRYA
ncbi:MULTISPECIES: LysR family transcriptional regulator [Rhizobium/Agrobacterium group]|nr:MULTISPECIES: LysR family transcriptional regulator [Rhizobium/Agrobacterium group]MCF1464765.1 LysR family transcriptional regulator [Allorhizobium ampelinum]MCF1495311.1 LysR family transcriptional regulator [Allorhizobium ampelinum]MUZ55368.1 LysR family transcriptional regulator [Agrobacterium vitis]MUZ94621.1 LysR family transcriptional regulator [Agrobacterium vitis]MVA43177.1 LysR family transcriptional regulator [Agrobacterium vitis]